MKGNREERDRLRREKVQVEFSKADLLILHVFVTLSDGRSSLIKILRRNITPSALKLIEEEDLKT